MKGIKWHYWKRLQEARSDGVGSIQVSIPMGRKKKKKLFALKSRKSRQTVSLPGFSSWNENMDDISEKCRTDINTDSKYTYYPSFRILLHSFSFSERWVQGQLKLLSPPLARHSLLRGACIPRDRDSGVTACICYRCIQSCYRARKAQLEKHPIHWGTELPLKKQI